MTTQQQAYINGFVKRASGYGFSEAEAIEILKNAVDNDTVNQPGQKTYMSPSATRKPVAPAPAAGVPAVNPSSINLYGPGKRKQAAELKGDQRKLDVDKDGKIEGEDLKKLRQRKQAADAAAQSTMNERITNMLPKFLQNSNLKGTKIAPRGAYGGVMGNAK